MIKNPPANAGNARDMGLIPVSERSTGIGNGNPLQYSCLENFMDGGAWCPWGHKESDMTKRLHFHFLFIPEWSNGFPYFLQFKLEFGNKEFMI